MTHSPFAVTETAYEDAFARYLKESAALERALGISSLADLHTR